MGIVKRQSIKTTIVSYIGVVIGAINMLWLFPEFLTAEEIGLVRILIVSAMFIAPFAQLGISGVIIRYFPYFRENQRKEFLFLVLLVPLIGYCVSIIIFLVLKSTLIYYFQEKSSLFISYLYFLIPLSFIFIFRDVLGSYCRSLLRIVIPKFINEVLIRMMVTGLLLMYAYYAFSRDIFIISYVSIYALGLILLLIYIKKINPLKIKLSFLAIKKSMLKQMFKYGTFMVLGGVSNIFIVNIDIWMIASLIGLSNTGIYTIALFMGTVIEMPRRAISQISLPLIAEAWKENNLSLISTLYIKTSLNQLIIGSILFIMLWINIDDIFHLIPNTEIYINGKYVVLFIGLAKLFDMATGLNSEIIMMSKYYRVNLLIMCFLIIIAIINNLIFIPIYGITGAAIATAISIFLFNCIKFLFVLIKIKLQPFSSKTLIVLLSCSIVFLIGYFLPDLGNIILNIIYKSVVIFTLYGILILKSNVSPDINKSFKEIKQFFINI